MFRHKLLEREAASKQEFRWRSHEVTRIEGLSDAVFAFAITLIVVSLEVPKTYKELEETMRGFVAFAISFCMLFQVWHTQYVYFRRYGLQDAITMVLNAILLFVVLFYTYPLKFLFTLLVALWSGEKTVVTIQGIEHPVISNAEFPRLMMIYSGGFVAVFGIFALMFWHAYRKTRELDLTPIEEFKTKQSAMRCLLNVSVGTLSFVLAVFGKASYAGTAYMLLFPVLSLHASWARRVQRRIPAVGDPAH